MKRTFRIYGAKGHRQRESFAPSSEFETWSGIKVQIRNADLTGTNEYSEIVIQAKTNEQIVKTLNGQINDGTFENSRTGKITEIVNSVEKQIASYE